MIQKFCFSREKLRKQQLELISMLNRWYCVKEDLIYAFEKCSDSGLGEPMKSYTKSFVTRIKCGLGTEEALRLFAGDINDKNFNGFITQIKFNLRYKGDTGELLDNLETQYIKIEEERIRRKITSSRDRKYIKILYLFTPAAAFIILASNPLAKELFIDTTAGNLVLFLCSVMYISGLFFIGYIAKGEK